MNQVTQTLQARGPQAVQNKVNKSGNAALHSHTMPGLVEPLARSFWQDRGSHSPRGMARNNEVAETHQVGACLRDLHRRLSVIEDVFGGRATVREFRIVGGRAA